MTLTPGSYTLQLRQDARGYNVLVPVPCVPCDGSGSRAIVHRHTTRYVDCQSCHGWGYVHARREVYSISRGQWFVLGADWRGQTFATVTEAAEAIAATLKPAVPVDPPARTEAEIVAAVTGFESPV